MEDLLIEIVQGAYGYPVRLQGGFAPDEMYPDNFFTYWNDVADGTSFYSNDEGAIIWQYQLNFYGTNPNLVNSILLELKPKLKAAGFTVTGGGHSVMSDFETHTGRGITVRYRQEI